MIVKVIPHAKAGAERVQMEYAIEFKREHAVDLRQVSASERQGAYALDLKNGGEKVEWSRTVNTGVEDPRWAIRAIEMHNARNTRKHSISRCEHIVVSFAEGERPTREQMAVIEDRLMDAIGFGNHPRVSAVHKPDGRNVNNWHLHIVVSRIDPATLKAEHPRYNHFSLQAEAAKLEIELGLRQERKTVLRREQEEIDRLREFHGPELEPPTPDASAQRAGRERQALDEAYERRHEKPYQAANSVEPKPSETARPWFHGIVEAWRQPASQPTLQEALLESQGSAPPADHLARDLLKTITSALKARDPTEQLAVLVAGVDRAVYIHNGNPDEPPSEFAKSLMRIATTALSVDEPGPVLIEGTGEAIQRHDLRRRQSGIERKQATETTAEARNAPKAAEATTAQGLPERRPAGRPDDRAERARAYWHQTAEAGRSEGPRSAAPDPRLIADRDEVKRLQQDAYLDRNPWSRPLTITDVARELSPRFKEAAEVRNGLFKEAKAAREERQLWGRARDANMTAEKHRLQEIGMIRRLLHRNRLKPDMILAEYEHGDWEAQTRLAELRRTDAVRRPKITAAVEAYKAALAEVYDHAEHELSRRITVATEARRRLKAHYEAIEVRRTQNQQERLRQRRRMRM